jgi:hypothetical protein
MRAITILVGAFVALSATGAAAADDPFNAAAFLTGCKLDLAGKGSTSPPALAYMAGECYGVVRTAASALSQFGLACPPLTTPGFKFVEVVVRYIEERPERLNEKFQDATIAALTTAWPCPAGKK